MDQQLPLFAPVVTPALTDITAVRQAGDARDKRMTLAQLLSLGGIANNAVQARRTTGLTLIASFVDVTLDTTDIETDDTVIEHDVVTDRIVVKVAGTYRIRFESEINNTLVGDNDMVLIQSRVRLNDAGTGINGSIANQSAFEDSSVGGANNRFVPHFNNEFIAILAANDFVTLQLSQIPDGSLQIFIADNVSFSVTRLL